MPAYLEHRPLLRPPLSDAGNLLSNCIQAIAKVLCALHNVTYTRTFHDQLSLAFDAYLSLLQLVKQHVNMALGRDGPDWRLQYLKDEHKFVPAHLHTMDGNNSMKHVDGSGHADERMLFSEYHIMLAQVDVFKDDVPKQTSSKASTPEESRALPCEGDMTVCANHWQAMNSASFENATQVFDRCGGFISTCHHGIVDTLIEMKRSGELEKNGLATLDKLLKVFKEDQGVGYDIGCSFHAMVACSSLAEWATMYCLLLSVNAFHGHAHNCMCQLCCHPLYLQDLHFWQWDEDKYLELSTFIYNNYKQALAIIWEYTPHVDLLKWTLGLDNSDFKCWHTEELQYLCNLEKEPE
ncbi:hypothetical protein K439DRAFT_1645026 [Ramaria rubella]|nr:hypothetical protein K439DRAFT_1645026 [Ramaria rubella]